MAMALPDPCKAELDALLARPPAEAAAGFEHLLERWPDHADELRRRRAAAQTMPRDTEGIRDLVFGALGAFAPPPSPQPAMVGHYRILRRLGAGGMGEVHLAFDPRLARQVAIKVLASGLRARQSAVARFLREARAVAALSHPGIGKVYEVSEESAELPFFSMEFVPGKPLDAVLEQLRDKSPAAISARDFLTAVAAGELAEPGPRSYAKFTAELMAAVARALHHAHERGVTHRDVKPHNIMIQPDGSAVLLDFGVAQVANEAPLTKDQEFVGTPSYASPEQVSRRGLAVDHRTDVYSLGVTLFETICLEPPFQAESTGALFRMIETKLAPSLRARVPATPRDLDAICAVALAKEPQHRYQSAADFAADLERFARGEPVVARPVRVWTRIYRWSRRNPTPVAVAILVLLLGLAMVVSIALGRANRTARDALGVSHYANARLQSSQGRYGLAFEELTSAREYGYPDASALLLVEFEALEGRGELDAAAAILAKIQSPPRDADLAARLLLLQGDFAVDRVADPDAGRAQIEAAVAMQSLAPADAAYARCLLADDIDTAWARVLEALEHEPKHRRACLMAAWLAIAHGDAVEALARLGDCERLFPEEVTLPLVRRGVRLTGGRIMQPATDDDASREASTSGQFLSTLLDGLELSRALADFLAEQQQLQLRAGQFVAVLAWAKTFPRLFAQARRLVQHVQVLANGHGPATRAGVTIHPLLVKAWKPIVMSLAVFQALGKRDPHSGFHETLHACATRIDDGFFGFLLGYLQARSKQYTAARMSFQRAIDRPSPMGVRRHALRIQLALDAGFAAEVLPGLTHEQLRPDVERNALALAAYPDLDPVEWDLAFNAALFCRSYRVAMLIATEWRRQHEDSVEAIKAEADLSARMEELCRARRLAKEALAIDASLPWATKIRDEVDRLLGK